MKNIYVYILEDLLLDVIAYVEKNSRKIFTYYLRLNGNETSHSSDIRKDEAENIVNARINKYCETYSILIKNLDKNK